ncbi:hypothetical protein R1sor_014078 [Riccia sorocarpa]|uniref:Endonuclease/exonuclease/phosphatase domain-containing protein n=1 Tax=Riccia sorocarpa TaxID=122646 RepID=A0ABD3HEJ1_9MARC
MATPRVEKVTRVGRSETEGGRDLWKCADLMAFVETWEWQESEMVISGFSKVCSVWNQRRFARGRGFGGLGVWMRESTRMQVELYMVDSLKQFLVLKITANGSSAFFIITYFAPAGAAVYESCSETNPFLLLSKEIIRLQELGPVWVVGDFISRGGEVQGGAASDTSIWRCDNDSEVWARSSDDSGKNRFIAHFVDFLSVSNVTILNGVRKFPSTHLVTYQSPLDSSALDFLMASHDARDRVLSFSLLLFQPESDHRPLLFLISGFRKQVSRRCMSVTGLQFDRTLKERYMLLLDERVQHAMDHTATVQVIMTTVNEVFSQRSRRRQMWFTEACCLERKTAMEATGPEQRIAFRKNKNLIKGVKRRFLREQQLVLAAEFIRNPQSFWTRLKPPCVMSELQGPGCLNTLLILSSTF